MKHIDTAEALEQDALRAIKFADGKPVEVAATVLAQAQVQATLGLLHATAALAEQQRLANLIQSGAAWEDEQQDAFEPTPRTLRAEVRDGMAR